MQAVITNTVCMTVVSDVSVVPPINQHTSDVIKYGLC